MAKGLGERSESPVKFLVIKHGGICEESRNPREGFKEITVTNPKTEQKVTKYVHPYEFVDGFVTKVEWYDTEQKYDQRYMGYKVQMDANGTPVVLDFPETSRVTSRFMKVAENIDWSKSVEFRAWKDREDNHVLWIKQDDESVPQKYTRDEPGDCPPPTQNRLGKWNYEAQAEFLHKRMQEVVIPAVEKANEWRHKDNPDTVQPDTQTDGVSETPASGEFDFDKLKTDLSELAEQDKKRDRRQIMEDYFGTARWSEVENLPVTVLKTIQKKIVDDTVPF